jgi:hypothetical protein
MMTMVVVVVTRVVATMPAVGFDRRLVPGVVQIAACSMQRSGVAALGGETSDEKKKHHDILSS